jgi:hypothetical protein
MHTRRQRSAGGNGVFPFSEGDKLYIRVEYSGEQQDSYVYFSFSSP